MIITIKNMIHIPTMDINLVPIVAQELTCENPLYNEALKAGRYTRGILPELKNFFVDNHGGFHLPRGYLSRLFVVANDLGIPIEVNDLRSVVPFEQRYEHSIFLRDYQNKALSNIAQHSEGLLVAPAGSGKTIIGISLILMCGQKCLWITHTKQLLHQFVDRIKQFVDIGEDDIGLIYKGDWDTGKPITAALVQTLVRNEDKLQIISDAFGTVIVDEAHHCPSTTFTKVINSLNPFYMYGLTATPKRRDGLEEVMLQNVGPVIHKIPRTAVAAGIITPIVLPRYIDSVPETMDCTYQTLLKNLVDNEKRTNIIVKDVIAEAKKGNICIVTTERVHHAEILYSRLKVLWPKTTMIIGKHKEEDRQTALEQLESGAATVLICTSHLLGEGFDYAPLNRLFITLPFRNPARCEQLVGRVQRTSPEKLDAWIYDYIDNHGLTRHQFRNYSGKDCRYNVYRNLGCTIK
jgi:superfamily II DNA or RNA helicase